MLKFQQKCSVSRPLPPLEQNHGDAMEIEDDKNTKVEVPIEQVLLFYKHFCLGISRPKSSESDGYFWDPFGLGILNQRDS